MQIVVLDGYTLNPGDLSWADLKALGPCTIYDRTPDAETVARATAGRDRSDEQDRTHRGRSSSGCRGLRYIGVMATGYNIVDIAAARERNIPVCNVPTTPRSRLRRWSSPIC